jgi:hypothetical protein
MCPELMFVLGVSTWYGSLAASSTSPSVRKVTDTNSCFYKGCRQVPAEWESGL